MSTEPNDEIISVRMTRAQALIVDAWLIGRDARMKPVRPGPDGMPTYMIIGAELNLRRRLGKRP
jgi:hypothetical protein